MTDTDTSRRFTVTLPELFPEGVPLAELGRFAWDLSQALKHEMTGDETAAVDNHPFALVGLTRSSAVYEIEVATAAVAPATRLLNAVEHPRLYWERLEPESQVDLTHALGRLARLGSPVRVSGPLMGGRVATYTPASTAVARPVVVSGETEAAVTVLSVYGQKKRKALVQPLAGGPAIKCVVESDRLLREIGANVKLRVILVGQGRWQLPGWELVGFTARSVRCYPTLSLREGLTDLAAAIGAASLEAAFAELMAERDSGGDDQ